MAADRDLQLALHRVALSGLGAAAAIALWALGESWDNPAMAPGLYLALFVFVSVFSAVALALAGPCSLLRALVGGFGLALPVTILASLAGARHVVATDVLDDPVMLTVGAVLVLFATPFLSVRLTEREAWRTYSKLFEAAWTMVTRYTLALAFVAIFWLTAFLSDALLQIVGIELIDDILGIAWVRFSISGAVLGLGLAVVYELRETVSPFVFLRLLRLLVPVVLAVVLVFLAAVPLRGLSNLFGDFSAAATLMGAGMVAVTLISTALDRTDAHAVRTPGLRLATRLLALASPLLMALAVWAVAIRVRQYGWTPDRVLAACVALFLLTYALAYAGSVLMGRGWMERIRACNVAMALLVILVSCLWMTPVLNAYRISANSQVARFEDGRTPLEGVPLWKMQNEWGTAGQRAVTHLEQLEAHPDHAALAELIDAARSRTNPYQFQKAVDAGQVPEQAAELARLLVVQPGGQRLPEEAFSDLPLYRIEHWLDGCRQPLPDGRAGCVLVQGRFSPSADGRDQGMVLFMDGPDEARGQFVVLRSDGDLAVRDVFDPVADNWPNLTPEHVAQALDGAFSVAPSGGMALHMNGLVLEPGH